MKRKIIFFISLLFFCINFVYAKDVFYFGWDNGDALLLDESNSLQTIKDNNIGFKHGYITTKIEIDDETSDLNSYMYYYDKSGNELKKEVFESTIFTSLNTDGDYIYAVAIVEDDITGEAKIVVRKLDGDFKIIKEKDITDLVIHKDEEGKVTNDEAELLLILPKIIGFDGIGITDDEIAVLYSMDEVVVLDKELTEAENVEFTLKALNKYFPNIGLFIKHINDFMEESETVTGRDVPTGLFLSSVKNGDDNIISSGVKLNVSSTLNHREHGFVVPRDYTENSVSKIDYLELDAKLVLFDNDYNQKWEVINTDYLAFLNTYIVSNYIVTIGLDVDFTDEYYNSYSIPRVSTSSVPIEDIHSDILIYDMDGNLVQTIANDSLYWGLKPTESGFIVSNLKYLMDYIESMNSKNSGIQDGTGVSAVVNEETEFSINSFDISGYLNDAKEKITYDNVITMTNEVWFIENNIKTNVVGKGSVTVVESSLAGNDVTFKVEPQEGYVLSVVKVIDQEGNVVTFTDYTFTMPSADVTIEAVFIKNPETVDSVIIFLVIFSISFLVMVFHKNKINYLN